jgi:hypothetical protein
MESQDVPEQITPEILAVLTAAAAVYLGKKAQLRSAHVLPGAKDRSGAWARQGRTTVLTSHNPRGNVKRSKRF